MNKKRKKDFDTVKFFRKVKTEISNETYGMTYEQLKDYFSKTPRIVGTKPQ
jgi:hypothetical protein